ncbi:MAG TPA: NAD-dependent deacylase [Methylocella sp.]|nr:NAD-dependent deacylase [Methylocella sp.]
MNIFILTGAGISAESGLGTFRDRDGLWARFDPMKLATPEAFQRDPDEVHAFYNFRRRNLIEAVPNAAHLALARLEIRLAEKGGALFLCTQNVDDLHERAGSHRVTHMHGELRKARCTNCAAVAVWDRDMGRSDICPACGASKCLRPHIVWFGEIPLYMEEIDEQLGHADLFVSIGTSGSVYPAAGFVAEARRMRIRTCELNLDPSDNAHLFDETCYGPASKTVPKWTEAILEKL